MSKKWKKIVISKFHKYYEYKYKITKIILMVIKATSLETRGFNRLFLFSSQFYSGDIVQMSRWWNFLNCSLIQISKNGILVSLWSCLLCMNQGAFRAILRILYCFDCRFLIFVWDVVDHIGHVYNKSGLIIDVYSSSEHLICSVEL